MKIIRAILLQKHWLNRAFVTTFLKDFLSGVGLIWLLIDVTVFFASPATEQILKSHLLHYLVVCVLYGAWRNLPRNAYKFKVRGRDSWIELRIGDILQCKGDIVVPFNDCFDASIGGRAALAPTVQGALIRTRYRKDACQLQADIDASITSSGIQPEASGSAHYPLGTVVPVSTQKGTTYLFASSILQSNNRVRGNAEDLARILPDLWRYIKAEGDKGVIVTPAIGTGHARTILAREESVEAIVKSFMESCSDRTYCNKMVVILHPDDIVNHKINVQYLVRFIQAYCEFARL